MITTVGTDILARILSDNSSAIINKMGLGSGLTAESLADTALAPAYTDHGFEQQTVTATYASGALTYIYVFTNGSTSERTVNEVGLFTDTGVLVYRHLFTNNELSNFGIIPAGESISITIVLSVVSKSFAGLFTVVPDNIGNAAISFYITVSATTTSTLDPEGFATPAPICYNGIELPNASIPQFSENLGAKSWNIRCYTTDYTLVTKILRYAGPLTVDTSITGKQYVLSSYRSGVLAIKNMSTHSFDLYSNCYIQGPISPAPFGDGWWFDVTVLQSAYAEV